jgi:hypothetical protein
MKKLIEYAKTLISMSNDYLFNNYDESLYADMVELFGKKMKDEIKNNDIKRPHKRH